MDAQSTTESLSLNFVRRHRDVLETSNDPVSQTSMAAFLFIEGLKFERRP